MSQEQPKSLGMNGNAPWWVKAIYVVGVPSAIALFLVWKVAIGFPEALQAHAAAAAEGLRQHAATAEAGHEAAMRLTTVMCVNAADTDIERRYCLSPALLDMRPPR